MSNNFRVRAFGTPNALTPDTISNGENSGNGYVQNFGVNVNRNGLTYLQVNGTPDSGVPQAPPSLNSIFTVPVKGVIKRIVINVQTPPSPTQSIEIQNNGSVVQTFGSSVISAGFNLLYVSLPIEIGDEISVYSNYPAVAGGGPGHLFVSLYIE